MADVIATYISEALEHLPEYYFNKFVFNLHQRTEEPRVRRREVEGKGVLDVTNLLLLKFTADRALPLTVETLRHIGCNQVADELLSKAPVDTGEPVLRKTPNGDLDLNRSQEAKCCSADNWPLRNLPAHRRPDMKTPKEVEDEAKARVVAEGRDPSNKRLVLSRSSIQFGQYRGKTFKWLLENDLRYIVRLVALHQNEQQHKTEQSSHMANKDVLTSYAIAYTEVSKEVRSHHRAIEAEEKSKKPGQEGEALVGFGRYQNETLKDLYESKDRHKISYVEYLRGERSSCSKASKMEDAIKYILKRDQKRRRKPTQSTR
ncbi:uncharacterized protein LOC131471760 isoform X2 [Solea solea]|uniref:uncharacterized protein LOC131471760 isoform X2 n=1 Tax=Solea solea TaxID=90069 RepID=UPI0027295208|nr:uncharacterized protein LOC131471760 isoform X2 [Solea solea]